MLSCSKSKHAQVVDCRSFAETVADVCGTFSISTTAGRCMQESPIPAFMQTLHEIVMTSQGVGLALFFVTSAFVELIHQITAQIRTTEEVPLDSSGVVEFVFQGWASISLYHATKTIIVCEQAIATVSISYFCFPHARQRQVTLSFLHPEKRSRLCQRKMWVFMLTTGLLTDQDIRRSVRYFPGSTHILSPFREGGTRTSDRMIHPTAYALRRLNYSDHSAQVLVKDDPSVDSTLSTYRMS